MQWPPITHCRVPGDDALTHAVRPPQPPSAARPPQRGGTADRAYGRSAPGVPVTVEVGVLVLAGTVIAVLVGAVVAVLVTVLFGVFARPGVGPGVLVLALVAPGIA